MRCIAALFLFYLGWPAWGQSHRSVSFANGKYRLAGTLTLPSGTGPHPAVIVVLGSGATNRDGQIDALKPFRVLATELARKGFTVLRYDNQSRGLSQGKSIRGVTTSELALDAQTAFDYVKNLAGIDPRRIGFIGHSEGATIAAIAASRIPATKFLLAINGPVLPGLDDILLTTEQRLRQAGTPYEAIRDYLINLELYLGRPASTSLANRKLAARRIVQFEIDRLPPSERAKMRRKAIESAVNAQMQEVQTRWEQQFLVLDPMVWYRKVGCPIRLLLSESELEGPLARRLPVIRGGLNARNQSYPVRLIKNADHNLILSDKHPKVVSSAFIKSIVEEASKVN